MPVNTSSTGGALLPGPGVFTYDFILTTDPIYWINSIPPDGQSLDDFLQQLISGITKLPPQLVRPRWQPEPPPLPSYGADWMAIGVMNTSLDPGWPWVWFDTNPASAPVDTDGNPLGAFMIQHEAIELQCSAYGPNADWYDGLIRDGFSIGQNQEVLFLAGMGLIGVGGRRFLPEFIQNRTWRRVERTIRIHREIRRLYPILSILEAPGQLIPA
jgi:hypothetical protein